MDDLQKAAAWCLPVGLILALSSGILLISLGGKKKEEI